MPAPLLITAVIGILLYVLCDGRLAKLSTVGLVIFACAMLAICMGAAPRFHLGASDTFVLPSSPLA